MKEFWNQRYGAKEYAYGVEPNQFLKEELERIKPGKALFPAEGEGRNAVFAAKLGWEVFAFDISESGKLKAEKLAGLEGVSLDYQVGTLEEMNYEKESFDLIVLIFAHFPKPIRSLIHAGLLELLKPGGLVILECFSKAHLAFSTANPKAGGPKEISMLFSREELMEDFASLQEISLDEIEVFLSEGEFHQGQSSVIRMIGQK
ncbi:class I SAM-dependent methyltransferase [Algoriphagus zhangzhouensis]|uniref:Methyltransferase domain-containing protein n=1 Tax=Algoriphagus zhangzhouensis TaxID=1073327 RepID=A0A1M7ZCR5_9BACT|nr:class I SAM-dependent methyltransferase [Algoriphagus zhangzhouensis]TDY45658.1 methyltransferase family protein [Algoriphagus zhangzhouensis]SHO62705.1 Methyltransferase domain-containing protein [Algoriphagus zhangzhouensis]